MAENYEYLFNTFTKEKISSRVNALHKAIVEFLSNAVSSFKNNYNDPHFCFDDLFYISGVHIQEAVVDYFADIQRLKDFHNIKKVNNIKIAAYLSYWVHKRHPIQTIKKIPDDVLMQFEKIRYINEALAIFIMKNFTFNLKVNISKKAEEIEMVNRFDKDLMYHFIYRQITPQELELIFTALLIEYPYPLLDEMEKQ